MQSWGCRSCQRALRGSSHVPWSVDGPVGMNLSVGMQEPGLMCRGGLVRGRGDDVRTLPRPTGRIAGVSLRGGHPQIGRDVRGGVLVELGGMWEHWSMGYMWGDEWR
jgi:hypothetical protein